MIKAVTEAATPATRIAAPRSKAFKGQLAAAVDAAQAQVQPQLGPQQAAAPEAAPQAVPAKDSPIAALLAAAVGRAIGAIRPALTAATTATATTATAAAPTPAPGGDAATTALTPLEQAVHELLGALAQQPHAAADKHEELAPHDEPHTDAPALAMIATAVPARTDAPAPAPTTNHVAGPASIAMPEPIANPSHVHLVLDDGPERIVMTIAVRGSDVHVALRGTDDTTASALARNASALDHAMRARGLNLADFTADRDDRGERQTPDPEPRQQRRDQSERFTLEETP